MAEKAEFANTRVEVLKLKLKGYGPRQIAEALDIRVVLVHTYIREIEAQIANKNLSELSPKGLELLQTTIGSLMPYMGKAMSDAEKSVKALGTLHTDVIETGEFTIHCIKTLVELEMGKETPDLDTLERTTSLLDKINKSFFNKEGIQIVNVLNDNSVNVEAERKAESLKALRKMAGMEDEVVDAEIEE